MPKWENFYKKELDGEVHALVAPPVNDGNHFNVNRDLDWLAAHGFTEWTDEEIVEWHEAHPAPVPETPPKKYSRLKIIRALGPKWNDYRAQLEAAGLLDEFFAAEYMAEDDPAFFAFLKSVPEELLSKLDGCLWEA